MQESNVCQKLQKTLIIAGDLESMAKKSLKFDNYAEAIDTVTKSLAVQYKAKGLETPEQIMTKYTPSNNGSWAEGVNYFMDQLNRNPIVYLLTNL